MLVCSNHLGNKRLNHLPYIHTYIKIYVCANWTLTGITYKAPLKRNAGWKLYPKLWFLNGSCTLQWMMHHRYAKTPCFHCRESISTQHSFNYSYLVPLQHMTQGGVIRTSEMEKGGERISDTGTVSCPFSALCGEDKLRPSASEGRNQYAKWWQLPLLPPLG